MIDQSQVIFVILLGEGEAVCGGTYSCMPLEQRDGNAAYEEVHLERAIRLLMFRLARLCMHRIKDPPEDAFKHHQCDIRDRLPPEPPKRAGAEPQVLVRERGKAIAHEHHTLECDLDQHRIALLP